MRISVDRVQGNTLAQQIRGALTERILSGELPPGTRLKDNQVAALFGTSNTPVREALRELAKDGLVEVLPHRGCMVRRLSLAELAEIFEVRIALESLAARLAAGRLTAAQLERLQSLVEEHEAAEAAQEAASTSASARAFHQLLVEASGNQLLAELLRHLDRRIHLARRMYILQVHLPDRITHRAILEVLRAGNGRRAAALMAEHIACGQQRMMEAIAAAGKELAATGEDH